MKEKKSKESLVQSDHQLLILKTWWTWKC